MPQFNVLHIEQSQMIQKMMKQFIISLGFNYYSTDDFNKAKILLIEEPINFIISGTELKDGTIEKFLMFNNENKQLPVIILTSNDSLEERKNMFNLGVIDYIIKGNLDFELLKRNFNFIINRDFSNKDLKNIKIAVVDDSKASQNIIKKILDINHFTNVEFYINGNDFLNDYKDKKYNIYFIDLILPDISGETIMLEIKNFDPYARIIAISGLQSSHALTQAFNCGADTYLFKPFDATLFLGQLNSNIKTYLLFEELKNKNN